MRFSLFGEMGRPINVKARFVNNLPGIDPSAEPKLNSVVTLVRVYEQNGQTYYKVKGIDAWFYMHRFARVK